MSGASKTMPPPAGSLEELSSRASHSWLEDLKEDPEAPAHAPNKMSRQVRSGHYVSVRPTPLPDPALVAFSPAMAQELGLSVEECRSMRFARFFSGDCARALPGSAFRSWCTPYALSIYGTEYTQQCPFRNGNGYGDGRAVSVAEVLIPGPPPLPESERPPPRRTTRRDPDPGERAGRGPDSGPAPGRWELQLKGGGTTPFCRGADGRAVLRSSVREFLASEAMHALGVPTTRALSLVVSRSETVRRSWYGETLAEDRSAAVRQRSARLPAVDDPRFAGVPLPYRRQMLAHLRQRLCQPDVMVHERCAITCRAAPSFVRVGHVELFARRARAPAKSASRTEELRAMVEHLAKREYPSLGAMPLLNCEIATPFPASAWLLALAERASSRIARLTAEWIRVGFVQGNFNSDNCLAGGRTMDYGPFGFVQRFEPMWNMWSGGGEHFGFLNQPEAGARNFASLASALSPLLGDDAEGRAALDAVVERHAARAREALNDVWRRKLGLAAVSGGPSTSDGDAGPRLAERLLALMERDGADWTILWRRLAIVAEAGLGLGEDGALAALEGALRGAFYGGGGASKPRGPTAEGARSDSGGSVPFADDRATRSGSRDGSGAGDDRRAPSSDGSDPAAAWRAWTKDWIRALQEARSVAGSDASPSDVARAMRRENPRYVPREWMLVAAYEAASNDDFSEISRLQKLFADPYAEPTDATTADACGPEGGDPYFRRAPSATYEGVGIGGSSFMS
jgi:uncharacterized protein YdiU (UPF0061 family)